MPALTPLLRMSAPKANTSATPATGGFKMSAFRHPPAETLELSFGDLHDDKPPVKAPPKPKTAAKPVTTGGAAAPATEPVKLVPSPARESVKLVATESVKLVPSTAVKVRVICSTCGKPTSVPKHLADAGDPQCWNCHTKTWGGGSVAPLEKPCGDCGTMSGKSYCPPCLARRKGEQTGRVKAMQDPDFRTAMDAMVPLVDTKQIPLNHFYRSVLQNLRSSVTLALSELGDLIALLEACVSPATALDAKCSAQLLVCFRNDLAGSC